MFFALLIWLTMLTLPISGAGLISPMLTLTLPQMIQTSLSPQKTNPRKPPCRFFSACSKQTGLSTELIFRRGFSFCGGSFAAAAATPAGGRGAAGGEEEKFHSVSRKE